MLHNLSTEHMHPNRNSICSLHNYLRRSRGTYSKYEIVHGRGSIGFADWFSGLLVSVFWWYRTCRHHVLSLDNHWLLSSAYRTCVKNLENKQYPEQKLKTCLERLKRADEIAAVAGNEIDKMSDVSLTIAIQFSKKEFDAVLAEREVSLINNSV